MNKVLMIAFVVALAVCFAAASEYEVTGAEPQTPAEDRGDVGGYAAGWSGGFSAWRPRFRYLNFRIPVPILPRVRIGIQHAAGGWGW